MMKKILILVSIVIVSCNNKNSFSTTSILKKNITCQDCLVTKEETAVRIATAVLYESYGEDLIDSEKPFIVNIENDSLWYIRGFYKIGYGGAFKIRISAKDGRVIEMYHEK